MKPLHLALVAGLLTLPGMARAQSTGQLALDPSNRPLRQSRVTFDLGYSYGEDWGGTGFGLEAHVVTPSLEVNLDVVELSEDVSLVLDLETRGVGVFPARGDAEYRQGNVLFGGRLAIALADGLRLRTGLGLVAPIANTYGGLDDLVVLLLGTAPHGQWDPWLMARGYVPIVLRGDLEYRSGILFLGGELDLGIGVPVLDGVSETGVALQFAAFGGVRPVEGLALGGRLQTLYADIGSGGGYGFAGLVPFVRGEFGAAFVEARAQLQLVENDTTRSLARWGVFVVGGASF